MDKYSGYVVIVYAVTLALLLGYLAWMWLRLRAVQTKQGSLEERP